MAGTLDQDRTNRTVLIIGSVVFGAIIVISLGFGVSANFALPSPTPNPGTPCVKIVVVEGSNTTYTTTESQSVVSYAEYLVVVNGTQRYTTLTTVTSTSTEYCT